jgi:hypothetical protein
VDGLLAGGVLVCCQLVLNLLLCPCLDRDMFSVMQGIKGIELLGRGEREEVRLLVVASYCVERGCGGTTHHVVENHRTKQCLRVVKSLTQTPCSVCV